MEVCVAEGAAHLLVIVSIRVEREARSERKEGRDEERDPHQVATETSREYSTETERYRRGVTNTCEQCEGEKNDEEAKGGKRKRLQNLNKLPPVYTLICAALLLNL